MTIVTHCHEENRDRRSGIQNYVRSMVPCKDSLKLSCICDLNKVIRSGTWNVQTMCQKGQVENFKQEMRMKINILALSEVRWKGAGKITSDECILVYSGGDSHQRGVCILIDEECSKALKDFWSVNNRP